MLLHRATRESLGIDLRDSVVVLDEAHNIIESINSAYSCGVTLGASLIARLQFLSESAKPTSLSFWHWDTDQFDIEIRFGTLICFALPCLALPCLALPCLALPCLALPCLALPCLALPCLALPCLALPCLALPCLALPCLALPCLALPCLALPCLALPCLYLCLCLGQAAQAGAQLQVLIAKYSPQ